MFSELFGEYDKLLRLRLLDKEIEVPENNTLLRGLQYISPSTISYGQFCWNGACNNCTVTVRNGVCDSKRQACRLDVREGMHVTGVSSEIRRNLPPSSTAS